MRALGVDAAGKRGWAGVVVDDGGFVAAHVAETLTALIDQAEAGGGRVDAIGIDIPIGLVDGPKRTADVAARTYVGPRRSSVFPAPHPAVVHLTEYHQVNEALRGLDLAAVSQQAFGLFARIREAAGLAADERLVEVFPEASFRAMGDAIVGSSKKTWNGAADRIARLAAGSPSIVLPGDLGSAGDVPADDVFDAAAVAWSALRYAHGRAFALGDPGELDPATGRRIAVWV
jgi:predicted RNase H-like nuclease